MAKMIEPSNHWIIVAGNAIDGLYFIGPFPDHDAAVEYGEDHMAHDDWNVTSMYDPEIYNETG